MALTCTAGKIALQEIIDAVNLNESNINSNNSFKQTEVTTTGAIDNNYSIILADASSGDIILSLPDPSTISRRIIIKRTDTSSNIVTITSAYNIDGDTSINLLPYEALEVVSNATQYFVV